MPENFECDNCGHAVVPLPDDSCPVCSRLICLPDDGDDAEEEPNAGPSPLHFWARCQDDQSKLAWGSRTPYALLVLINILCFQIEGLGEKVFVGSFVAALLSVYCTRVFFQKLSELAALLSPNNAFWEGFIRTVLSFALCGVIVLFGGLIFGRS